MEFRKILAYILAESHYCKNVPNSMLNIYQPGIHLNSALSSIAVHGAHQSGRHLQ